MTSQDDKREPRVYFIAKLDPYDGRVFDKDPRTFESGASPHTVKELVEKSAYDALLAENQKLKAENAVLREAVEFYAHSKDAIFEVVDEGRGYDVDNVIYESDLSPEGKCDQPHGTKAREALKKVEK